LAFGKSPDSSNFEQSKEDDDEEEAAAAEEAQLGNGARRRSRSAMSESLPRLLPFPFC
jgi:hypothetical protein